MLGASGMIGRAILAAARGAETLDLVPASHRQRPGHRQVDFESLTTAEAWVGILGDEAAGAFDAVVNCVGIWSGSAERFEHVQYTVPVALFEACRRLGIRVVQVSALGFSADSPLPYAATKARADRALLDSGADAVVVCPSLVFGSDGDSSRFFLNLAALPLQVDFGFARNLQPVHVDEVAQAVVAALRDQAPPRTVACAGPRAISIPEYFDALRAGMGLRPVPLRLRLPRACGRLLFEAGDRLGLHFVNRQSMALLDTGTQLGRDEPAARPYETFATPADRQAVHEHALYLFARVGIAVLWLWTAFATWFAWPHAESLAWLDSLWPGLGTPAWLAASCGLDAAMGIAALVWPRRRLWLAQCALTAVYTLGMAVALPWTALHPLGPLTKNLAVMASLLFLAQQEARRGR